MKSRTALPTQNQTTEFHAAVIQKLPRVLTAEQMQEWIRDKTGLGDALHTALVPSGNWLNRLVQAEHAAHKAFFGQTFDLSQFRATLDSHGEERVNRWVALGLEPHFLPQWQFRSDEKLRRWKIRPETWLWQQLAAGNIKRRNASGELITVTEVGFDGVTVLVDTRCKPAYDGGRQMFKDDEAFLGGLIRDLRSEGKIVSYDSGPQDSRFGVSSEEWDNYICPAFEVRPEFECISWRLELAIEANTIPQIYRQMPRCGDGKTNTWVWYEEFFKVASFRLLGGSSVHGGLAYVYYYDADYHWYNRAVRPLGVVATLPLGS